MNMDYKLDYNTNIMFGPRDAIIPDRSVQQYLYKQLQLHDKNKTLYVSILL